MQYFLTRITLWLSCVLLLGHLTTFAQVSNIHLLPNGKIGMNTASILGVSDLTLKSTNATGLGGMVVETPSGTTGQPFYGYGATGVIKAYSYYDFATATWKMNVAGDRLSIMAAGRVGIGTTTPDVSAILDVSSTNKGFLPPRMSTAQRLGIGSPAEGLLVFDTDEEAIHVYQGGAWEKSGTAIWGTNNPANGIDYHDGPVTIGVEPSTFYRFHVESDGFSTAARLISNYASSGLKTGVYGEATADGTGARYGVFGQAWAPPGVLANTYGVYARGMANSSDSDVYGLYATTFGLGNGTHYGVFASSTGAGNYGIYAENPNVFGHAGYFDGKVNIDGSTVIQGNLFLGPDTTVRFDPWGHFSAGELEMWDNDGDLTVRLRANQSNTEGSELMMMNASGAPQIILDAQEESMLLGAKIRMFSDGYQNAGLINLLDNDGDVSLSLRGNESGTQGSEIVMFSDVGDSTIQMRGEVGEINLGLDQGLKLQGEGYQNAAEIEMYDDDGTKTMVLRGNKNTSSGSQLLMYDDLGNQQMEIDAQERELILGTNDMIMEATGYLGAAQIRLFDNDGTETVSIRGNRSTVQGSELLMFEENGAKTVDINGELGDIQLGQNSQIQLEPTGHDEAAELIMRDNDGDVTFYLWGNKTPTSGAFMALRNDAATGTIELDAQDSEITLGASDKLRLQGVGFQSAAEIEMYDDDGDLTVAIRANENTSEGAEILLRNDAGTTTVQLDADRAGTGEGIIITDRLDFDESANRFTILNGEEADFNSDGYLQLGQTTTDNLVLSVNHITARDNGSYAPLLLQNYGGDILLCGTENGQVGIGLTSTSALPSSDYLLAVNGKMVCEELRVDLHADWPDYVFKDGYHLRPLHQLKQEIRTLGHLPGIPSASQIKEEGLHVGEMQRKMLEKIEELTLYILQQQEQIDQLSATIEQLTENK